MHPNPQVMTALRYITAEIEKLREEVKDLKKTTNVRIYVIRMPAEDSDESGESTASAPPSFPSVD